MAGSPNSKRVFVPIIHTGRNADQTEWCLRLATLRERPLVADLSFRDRNWRSRIGSVLSPRCSPNRLVQSRKRSKWSKCGLPTSHPSMHVQRKQWAYKQSSDQSWPMLALSAWRTLVACGVIIRSLLTLRFNVTLLSFGSARMSILSLINLWVSIEELGSYPRTSRDTFV